MVSTFTRTWFALPVLFLAILNESSRAVADKTENAPNLRTLRALIGKGPKSKELALLRKQLKSDPEVSRFPDCFYHSWKQHGLEILFQNGTVRTIFLYAEGADEFKPYRGELPDGLRLSDSRRDVEKKLGKSKETGGSGVIPFWAEYPEKGLSITYVSTDTEDPRNKIHHIGIYAVRKK